MHSSLLITWSKNRENLKKRQRQQQQQLCVVASGLRELLGGLLQESVGDQGPRLPEAPSAAVALGRSVGSLQSQSSEAGAAGGVGILSAPLFSEAAHENGRQVLAAEPL